MLNRRWQQAGFTLIEILVALAVMVIAMTALWKGLAQGVAVSQGMSDRVVARWVAENRIVERQVMNEWPDARAYNGTEQMGGRTWYWQEQIVTTGQANLRSITVSVGLEAESALISLQGFLHQPDGASLSVGDQSGGLRGDG
jgi:general secretion pathway protein I